MAPTIFIKFCGFIAHSNLNNTALSVFPEKILITRKIFFNFLSTLMLRVVHIRNKKRNDRRGILQTWSIVFVAMLLNQQERSQRKYCYQQSRVFLVLIFLLFRHKISGFRINCFKFTQYSTKISRLIFIIIL